MALYLAQASAAAMAAHAHAWRAANARSVVTFIARTAVAAAARSRALGVVRSLVAALCAPVCEGGVARDTAARHKSRKPASVALGAGAYLTALTQAMRALLAAVPALGDDEPELALIAQTRAAADAVQAALAASASGAHELPARERERDRGDKDKDKAEPEEPVVVPRWLAVPVLRLAASRAREVAVMGLASLLHASGPAADSPSAAADAGAPESPSAVLERVLLARLGAAPDWSDAERWAMFDLRVCPAATLSPERVASIRALMAVLDGLPTQLQSRLLMCLRARADQLLGEYYCLALESRLALLREGARPQKNDDIGAIVAGAEDPAWVQYHEDRLPALVAEARSTLADAQAQRGSAGKRANRKVK
jgi:hypothetical protein